MIGTSISVQHSGEMQYPSITICESMKSGRVFANGQFFESAYDYKNWIDGTNITPIHYVLNEGFLGMGTKMPNKSAFLLKQEDIDNRDDYLSETTCCHKC